MQEALQEYKYENHHKPDIATCDNSETLIEETLTKQNRKSIKKVKEKSIFYDNGIPTMEINNKQVKSSNNKVEILEGLEAGDRIVEDGIRLIKDQQLVKNI